MQCENVTSVPGPNPGCAGFAGPEEIPCGAPATVTIVLDDPSPYPGDSDLLFLHVCEACADQIEQDADYVTTYPAIVPQPELVTS